MRLSWYADTGVAVFSIWQAGTCTGTFRLPIADLTRMIGTLSAGPPSGFGGPPPADAGYPASETGYLAAGPGYAEKPHPAAGPGYDGAYPAAAPGHDPLGYDSREDDPGDPRGAGYPGGPGYPGDPPYQGGEAGLPEPGYRGADAAARPGGHWDGGDPHYPPAGRQDGHPGRGSRVPFTGQHGRTFAQDYVRAFPGDRAGTFTGPLSPQLRPEPMPAFAAEAVPAQSGRSGRPGAGAGRTVPAATSDPAAAVYPADNGDPVLEPEERSGESFRYRAPALYEGRPSGR